MVSDAVCRENVGAQVASASLSPIVDLLLASLAALAKAGDVEAACRMAGQACVTLRRTDPAAARRFDVLLHRMTPALIW